VPRGTPYAGDVLAGIAIGLIAERVSDAAIDLAMRWAWHVFARPQRAIGGEDATPVTRRMMAPSSPGMPQDGKGVGSSQPRFIYLSLLH